MAKENNSALAAAFAKINKMYGTNSVLTLSDATPANENLISTGSLLIDQALGGGVAMGRIAEIYGVESSGKSTLCLQIAAECQKAGGKVAYIDVENALDVEYARHLGVNTDELIFSQPSSAEQALDIVDILGKTGEVQLIIVDSVAALAPQAELDGEMADMTIGLVARILSKALRKITASINQNRCAVIFINQIREKISTGFSGYGEQTTTPGGRALKFFASQRIELRKTSAIKAGNEVIGTNVKVKITKNKIAPPMKVCEVPMIFGEGFSAKDEVIDLAIEYELIQKGGAWFTLPNGQRLQGKESVKGYYVEHEDEAAKLREEVVKRLKGTVMVAEYEVDPVTGEVLEDMGPRVNNEVNLDIE